MNIDKAIEHAFEVSTTCENASCALEHVQLAFWLKQLKELQSILGYSYDLDRLKELAEADKEGRCLVLPCKVGDTYYAIQKTCSDGGCAKKGEYFPCESDCEYCDIRDCDKEFIIREHKFNSLNFIVDYMKYIGEFLFLTKEEAEKALEGLE